MMEQKQIATLVVKTWDDWDRDWVSHELEMPMSEKDVQSFKTWASADFLLKYMKENAVGRMTALGDEKFIPSLECECGFEVSVQINYQLWRHRNDIAYKMHMSREEEDALQMQVMREEELLYVLPDVTTWVDVRVMYKGRRLFLGQMSLAMVAQMFKELAEDGRTEFEDY